MKIKTHLKLATICLASSKPYHQKKLNLPFFYLGVILADMSWLSKTHPHYPSRSLDYIQNKIHKLMHQELTPYHSMQLGIVMHYLCDFCCVVHQNHSVGNLRAHIRYERALSNHLKQHVHTLSEPPITESFSNMQNFNAFLEQHLATYRERLGDYHWDLKMATKLGTTLCRTILS